MEESLMKLGIYIVIVIMTILTIRALAAWAFRINTVINELRAIKHEVIGVREDLEELRVDEESTDKYKP